VLTMFYDNPRITGTLLAPLLALWAFLLVRRRAEWFSTWFLFLLCPSLLAILLSLWLCPENLLWSFAKHGFGLGVFVLVLSFMPAYLWSSDPREMGGTVFPGLESPLLDILLRCIWTPVVTTSAAVILAGLYSIVAD